MFIKNKYHDWYFNLCENRKTLKRIKSSSKYYEQHHIIPRCCGGDDSKNNLVLLTAREHFIAHVLLTKFTFGKQNEKLTCALILMSGIKKYNSKEYNKIRKSYSIIQKNKRLGKTHTKKTKKIISDKAKLRLSLPENNPMYGKAHSDATKEKISKKNSGSNNGFFNKQHSQEYKKIMSEINTGKNNPMYGKKASDTTKSLLSKQRKGVKQKRVKCPHCEKVGGLSGMSRYHFDNCKFAVTYS